MHKNTDVRIVEVRETPKFYIIGGNVKFRKINNPTPDRVGELYSNGTSFNGYTLSEIGSSVVQRKLAWIDCKNQTQEVMRAINKKFEYNAWRPNDMQHLTLEQAKHLNEYLNLGLEIDE